MKSDSEKKRQPHELWIRIRYLFKEVERNFHIFAAFLGSEMNINADPLTFCELVLCKCVDYKEVTAGTLLKCVDGFLHILMMMKRVICLWCTLLKMLRESGAVWHYLWTAVWSQQLIYNGFWKKLGRCSKQLSK